MSLREPQTELGAEMKVSSLLGFQHEALGVTRHEAPAAEARETV